MMTMLGLAMMQTGAKGAEAPVPTTSVTINDFSRDRSLFDSGVAVGLNAADIPISGTGTPNEAIEYRIVPEGAAPSDWLDLLQVPAGGLWATTLTLPRNTTWMRIEVRVKSEPFVRNITANRFGVGHVIAIWGQSEVVRLHSTAHDTLIPEPLLNDDQVQAMWFDGAPVLKHLSQADPHSSALAAMANVLIAERPDDKFAIVFQAVSGTGFRELVDDANAGRAWADDATLHAFATADGQHVGLPAVSWFASPGALSEYYDDALFPIFTGKTIDGTAVSFPAQINYGSGQSYTADHWFGEFYDTARTRWVAFGPHRFDIGADMQTATLLAGGQQQFNLFNKQQVRESWRAMVDNPFARDVFLPLGIEPLSYQNGVTDGAGGWQDYSHPAGNTDDGAPRLARLTAHAILQASGLSGWAVPEFDNSYWEPTGAFVEFWSDAGPVTTTRLVRGETALDDSFAHWTDVFGWQINGMPAERAEIENGRVRVYPNTGVFTPMDVINFGEGGASGMIKFPEDHYAHTYLNLPVVDVGASGVEGISVRPLPADAVLENTLVAGSSSFTTAATGPHFVDIAQLGAGVSKLHLRFDLSMALPSSGARILCTTTGNYLKLDVLPDGSLRLRVRDTDGTVLLNNVETSAGAVLDSVQSDVVLSVDMQAGFARIWVSGTMVLNQSFTPASGELPSNRILLLLATMTGVSQVVGEIAEISIWKDTTGEFVDPSTASYKTISGPAAVVNSDAWKRGDDAL